MSNFRKFAAKYKLDKDLYTGPLHKRAINDTFPEEWNNEQSFSFEEYAAEFYKGIKVYGPSMPLSLEQYIDANRNLIWEYFEQGVLPMDAAQDVFRRLERRPIEVPPLSDAEPATEVSEPEEEPEPARRVTYDEVKSAMLSLLQEKPEYAHTPGAKYAGAFGALTSILGIMAMEHPEFGVELVERINKFGAGK